MVKSHKQILKIKHNACKKFWSELVNVIEEEGGDMASWGNWGEIIDVMCKHTGEILPEWRNKEKVRNNG